jgi:hypothetical protein
MSAAAVMRLTQLHGEPKSTLAGPAHAVDGMEVQVLPWPDQTPHNGDRSRGNGVVIWCAERVCAERTKRVE